MTAHLVGGDTAVDIAHRTHGEAVAAEGIFVEEEQTGVVRTPQLIAAAHHGARNGESGVAIGDEQARCADRLRFSGAQSGGNYYGRTEQQAGEKKFVHESRGKYDRRKAPQARGRSGAKGKGVRKERWAAAQCAEKGSLHLDL